MVRMKESQKVTDKIERFGRNLSPGTITTSAEVVKSIGGRRVTNMLVGSVFKAMPEMEHVQDRNNGVWMRK